MKLPPIPSGDHELLLKIPYGEKTGIEWCYLLGDFGVHVAGCRKTITPPVKTLHFGDWVHQGLPFYGGNVPYHYACSEPPKKDLILQIPQYRGPVMAVEFGGEKGSLAFSPYTVRIGKCTSFSVTLYGNLINTFGQLHNCNKNVRMYGPGTWRETDESNAWSYTYQLKPIGILTPPVLYEVIE